MSRHPRNLFEDFTAEGSGEESLSDISDLDPDFSPDDDCDDSDLDYIDAPSTSHGVRSRGPKRKAPTRSRPRQQKRQPFIEENEPFLDDGSDVEEDNIDDSRQSTPSPDITEADWTQCLENFPNQPPFTGDCGFKFNTDEASVLSCFQLFFGKWMTKHLKEQTNKYAAEMKARQPHRQTEEGRNILKNWKPVTMKDMKGFILILIHMGVVRKSSINDYWSTELFIAIPFASTIIPRDRFKAILSFFHMSDNSTYIPIGEPNHDPLHKIRPVYEYLQQKFQEVYVPSQKIAIDEAICSWRGRLRFKVYMKDKPNPWGIKLYQLCESGSGYTFRFEIYASESHVSNKPTDVVLRLLEPLLEKGYHVFTDNYYTCPALYNTLVERGTSCTGTVRSNRLGMPKDLALQKLKTGEISFRRKRNLCAMKWSDKRDVMILTSAHDPTATELFTSRNIAEPKDKPVCVLDYTKNMCGVDQSDQLMSYLPLARRTMKWSKKVFVHLLTLSIVQANILFNKIQREKSLKPLALPFFIRALGKALIEDFHMTEPTTKAPEQNSPGPKILQRLNHKVFHHLVSLPPTASKNKPRRECKVCRDIAASLPGKTPRVKETYHLCKVCQIPLCIEPCFFLFHNRQNYISAAKDNDN